jgi:hypothetical protein
VGVILKLNTWKLWLLSGICFLFLGISYLISKKYFLGAAFIFLGGFYFILSRNIYKGNNKSGQVRVPDIVSGNMNSELKNLIEEGKKIKAIKKYRMITGLGLKEAKEYVDLLSQQSLNK